ncbi:riboflavin synthase [soil metagenome]
MFTGIIQAVGHIRATAPTPAGVRLWIDPGAWVHPLTAPALGESIAVSGICLTIAELDAPKNLWGFDAIPATLARTTAGIWRAGHQVNLEPAALASTPMGGHLVQGHIDNVAHIDRIDDDAAGWRVRLRVPADLSQFLLPRGSVALDGVSLTIADLDLPASTLTVALIPHTLQVTTLGRWRVGAAVNLEVDAAAKAIVETVRRTLAQIMHPGDLIRAISPLSAASPPIATAPAKHPEPARP